MDETKPDATSPEPEHIPCEHEVLRRAELAFAELRGVVAGLTANTTDDGDAAGFAERAFEHLGDALVLLHEIVDDFDAADHASVPAKAN